MEETEGEGQCSMTARKVWYCNFCGKHQDEVLRMVVSNDTAICNECILLCGRIVVQVGNGEIEYASWFAVAARTLVTSEAAVK